MNTTFETLETNYLRQKAILDAWKELSGRFNWSETLLEKYQDKLDWDEVSDNREIQWTIPMLEKFKERINWDVFIIANKLVLNIFGSLSFFTTDSNNLSYFCFNSSFSFLISSVFFNNS